MACPKCNDEGWVCESHPDKPQSHPLRPDEMTQWDRDGTCGGAGMPCDCGAACTGFDITIAAVDGLTAEPLIEASKKPPRTAGEGGEKT